MVDRNGSGGSAIERVEPDPGLEKILGLSQEARELDDGEARDFVRYPGGIQGFPSSGRAVVGPRGGTLNLEQNQFDLHGQDPGSLFDRSSAIGTFNSMLFVADDDLSIFIEPGNQAIHYDAGAWASIPIANARSVRMKPFSDRPFVFWVWFSSSLFPPIPGVVAFHQERFSESTITKVAGAGNPDDLLAVNFAASDGATQGDTANEGAATVHVGHIGQKVFIIDNSSPGAVSVDVNLRGLLVSGQTWIDDPSTGAFLTVPAGGSELVISNTYYQLIELRARASDSVDAAGASTLKVQYRGFTPGMG